MALARVFIAPRQLAHHYVVGVALVGTERRGGKSGSRIVWEARKMPQIWGF